MVNHVRTLLLNLPGTGLATGPGEAYSPPEYRPVALPAPLRQVRRVLFGADPDRRGLLYRTAQYLHLLHASARAADVLAFDPRVTYLPLPVDRLVFPAGVTVTPVGTTAPLIVTGPVPAGTEAGRLSFTWLATLSGQATTAGGGLGTGAALVPLLVRLLRQRASATTAAGTTALTVTGPVPGGDSVTAFPRFVNHLSDPVPVPGARLQVQYPAAALPGASWVIQVLARPALDPGAVLARLAALGPPVLDPLFGTGPEEPYRTYRRLFEAAAARPLPDRLGAALLALAGRTEALRTGAGGRSA